MTQTTIENPNYGPRKKVSHMMVSLMLKVYKTSKEGKTTITITTKTTIIQTMTIRIKAISNLVIKHNFFLTITKIPIEITTMTMIKIGSSLTFVNPWMPYFKN